MCTSEIPMGAIKLRGGMACGSSKFNFFLCGPKSIVLVVYEMTQFIVYCNDTISTIMALGTENDLLSG